MASSKGSFRLFSTLRTQYSGAIKPRLRRANCEVLTAQTPADARQLARSSQPDCVLLDGNLSAADPLELSWQIRDQLKGQAVPVFFLSQCTEATDANGSSANGSEAPPCIASLVEQFAGYLGRGEPSSPESGVVNYMGLSIDRRRHRATIDDRRLDLTPTEFRLLWMLSSQPGFVLPREELTEACLSAAATVQQRTIDAHIKAIRRKLEDRGDLIETVRGVGYRFVDG